jgi:hypothetical protein
MGTWNGEKILLCLTLTVTNGYFVAFSQNTESETRKNSLTLPPKHYSDRRRAGDKMVPLGQLVYSKTLRAKILFPHLVKTNSVSCGGGLVYCA